MKGGTGRGTCVATAEAGAAASSTCDQRSERDLSIAGMYIHS